jgi:hypothetical protein
MVKEVKTAKASSFVGIDLGHKTWHACRFSHAGDHEFFSGAMDARFIATKPEKALPIVRTPDTNTEYLRKLVSERAEIVRHVASNKSRFYGLCIQAGITSVRKRDLRTAEHMAEIAQKLPQRWRSQ